MTDPSTFFDICALSLNHKGEELCGDQVKTLRTPRRSIVVLSDGLGSGVKANILARLTSEIIVNMIRAEAGMDDVMETVIGTLPVCKKRKVAYATFIVVEIRHDTGAFRVINFDTPDAMLIKRGRPTPLDQEVREVAGKELRFSEGILERGDLLGIMSDGILYAGMGGAYNFGWGREQISKFLEETIRLHAWSAEGVSERVLRETKRCYGDSPGDDATFVSILARRSNSLMVFTGPPLERDHDEACVERFMAFPGRKVVCGGTTGEIVGIYTANLVKTLPETADDDIPPIGKLPDIDLVTEGILTLAATLKLMKDCDGVIGRLPSKKNGAVLLSKELLKADSITILAGESINPYYQNPLLPRSVSIRRSVLVQIVTVLESYGKEITIEWC